MAYVCPLKIKVGSQFFENILEGSLSTENKSFQRSRASFTLKDETGTYTPVVGSEVMIADTRVLPWTEPAPPWLLFHGIVKDYTKDKPSPSSETRFITIDCVDTLSLIEDRRVTKTTYSDIRAQVILGSLLTVYAPTGKFVSIGPDVSIFIPSITFDYCTVLEAIQRLADACGCAWWIDTNVDSSSGNAQTAIYMNSIFNSPYTLPTLTSAVVKDYSFAEDNPAYRNYQIVRSGEVTVAVASTDEIGLYGRQVDNCYELKTPLPASEMTAIAQNLLTRYAKSWRRLTFKTKEHVHQFPGALQPVSLPEYTGNMWLDMIKVNDEGPVLWYEVQCVEQRECQLKDDWAGLYDGVANKETAQGFQVFSVAMSVNGTGATLATTDAVLFGGSYPTKPHWCSNTPVVVDDSDVRIPVFTSVWKWLRETSSSDYIGVILGVESTLASDNWQSKVNFFAAGSGFEHTAEDWWEEEP